jgi:hypothetical protein
VVAGAVMRGDEAVCGWAPGLAEVVKSVVHGGQGRAEIVASQGRSADSPVVVQPERRVQVRVQHAALPAAGVVLEPEVAPAVHDAEAPRARPVVQLAIGLEEPVGGPEVATLPGHRVEPAEEREHEAMRVGVHPGAAEALPRMVVAVRLPSHGPAHDRPTVETAGDGPRDPQVEGVLRPSPAVEASHPRLRKDRRVVDEAVVVPADKRYVPAVRRSSRPSRQQGLVVLAQPLPGDELQVPAGRPHGCAVDPSKGLLRTCRRACQLRGKQEREDDQGPRGHAFSLSMAALRPRYRRPGGAWRLHRACEGLPRVRRLP